MSENLVTVDFEGEIFLSESINPKRPKEHQIEAMRALNQELDLDSASAFAGLLVLPTGAGKTYTAVYWLVENVFKKGFKVLWLAHRHELLNQALQTFKDSAYKNESKNVEKIKYRIISGDSDHGHTIDITGDDDLIIAGKDSLQKENLDNLERKWLRPKDRVFLIIDEAHHAPARTYRNIIERLKAIFPHFKMLGLTATPFRTSEKEKGALKAIFPNDIIYKVDLKTLIARGVLAQPEFIEIKTGYSIGSELSTKDISYLQQYEGTRLPETVTNKLYSNRERNFLIVDTYAKNAEKFGQTILFALDQDHAVAMSTLLNDRISKDTSRYVISGISDMQLKVSLSADEIKESIQQFRDGKVSILVNVNILTEGFDAPQASTVFLTRPSNSTILMTQMIGRALRGPKMGGKEKAYIVSFIDDWQDKISLVSPESLYIGEFESTETISKSKNLARLISISKIQDFVRLLNDGIDTDLLEQIDAIDRIPLGVFSFLLDNDKSCDILIYSHNKEAYDGMMADLPDLFSAADKNNDRVLSEDEIDEILVTIKKRYFDYCDSFMYREEDIKDVLRYFSEIRSIPSFYAFENRDQCDVSQLVKVALAKELGPSAEKELLENAWHEENSYYRLYFAHNFKYFKREYDIEKNKIYEAYSESEVKKPFEKKGQVSLEKLSLSELKKRDYAKYKALTAAVYEKALGTDGFYHSASGKFKSKYKMHFQIDHIIPISKEGGLTTPENLQLLSIKENREKGNRL